MGPARLVLDVCHRFRLLGRRRSQAYFDAPTAYRRGISGAQNLEYQKFSSQALKAAQGKLADLLAMMPREDLEAARAQVTCVVMRWSVREVSLAGLYMEARTGGVAPGAAATKAWFALTSPPAGTPPRAGRRHVLSGQERPYRLGAPCAHVSSVGWWEWWGSNCSRATRACIGEPTVET
jgi:hypothetical protein